MEEGTNIRKLKGEYVTLAVAAKIAGVTVNAMRQKQKRNGGLSGAEKVDGRWYIPLEVAKSLK